MPTARARFRISIKDHHTGEELKVELVDAPGLWGERRYAIRVNGKPATKVKVATLSEVFHRLRRWTVARGACCDRTVEKGNGPVRSEGHGRFGEPSLPATAGIFDAGLCPTDRRVARVGLKSAGQRFLVRAVDCWWLALPLDGRPARSERPSRVSCWR